MLRMYTLFLCKTITRHAMVTMAIKMSGPGFKTNDVKFSNVLYANTLPFLPKKSDELLHCKCSSQFFFKNTTTIYFVRTVRLNKF